MSRCVRTASIYLPAAGRARLVFSAVLAFTIAPFLAPAGRIFAQQPNPVYAKIEYFKDLRDQWIASENRHHEAVEDDLRMQSTMAGVAENDNEKTCKTARCGQTYNTVYKQTLTAILAKEDAEKARHEGKIKQIKTDLGAEIKKLEAQAENGQ